MFEPDFKGQYTSFCIANELQRRHYQVYTTIEKITKTIDSSKISSAEGDGIWIIDSVCPDKNNVTRKCFKMNLAGLHYVLNQLRIQNREGQSKMQDIAIVDAGALKFVKIVKDNPKLINKAYEENIRHMLDYKGDSSNHQGHYIKRIVAPFEAILNENDENNGNTIQAYAETKKMKGCQSVIELRKAKVVDDELWEKYCWLRKYSYRDIDIIKLSKPYMIKEFKKLLKVREKQIEDGTYEVPNVELSDSETKTEEIERKKIEAHTINDFEYHPEFAKNKISRKNKIDNRDKVGEQTGFAQFGIGI